MELDCDYGECAVAVCTLALDLPGGNEVSWSAKKILTGVSSAQMRDDWVDNGMVTVLDVVAIEEHLQDYEPFFGMIQYIQADVNGDLMITGDDENEITNLILGYSIPAMPPWTFVSGKWFELVETFYTSMFLDYEPSYEDFLDFYDLHYNAFNRIENSVLMAGSWSSTFYEEPSSEVIDYFNGFKIGDLNYTQIPNDFCYTCLTEPEEDVILTRSSGPSDNSKAQMTIQNFGYFSELKVHLDNISDIKALQFEVNFANIVPIDVVLLGTICPNFSDANYYFDQELNTLRCAWIDRKLNPYLRDEGLNEETTFTFRIDHTYGSLIDLNLSANTGFNIIGFYGSNREVPLIFESVQAATELAVFNAPKVGSNYIEFDLDVSDGIEAQLALYNITGQLIGNYKTIAVNGRAFFELPLTETRTTFAHVVYILTYANESRNGRFVTY